jgi:uncharacterized protein YeaO (DUF488 family)
MTGGIKKEDLQMEAWLKDVAPSDGLRRWFGHDPAKWREFRRRYFAELKTKDACKLIRAAARRGNVTLLYSTRDEEHNNEAPTYESVLKFPDSFRIDL